MTISGTNFSGVTAVTFGTKPSSAFTVNSPTSISATDPAGSAGEKKKSQWFDRVTFQWFRHYFISHAVMAGIDFKTIATWVSHRDGGILIGRLYGHLERSHSRRMAVKLSGHLSNHT